ncbi:SMP-30/gluconolactonase/LRE family protein [Micromonospora coxensis]|uniref:Sugar lactone lactonase YvrE n=1 Tax=Micromonospora coxensis TaxID=356852 RepID=A0A1C5HRQ5_9ACTN|nr:superoxide dismutase [Micromonospora coxensis]SCG48642.1 Sugar lactone lactonase YvrE [Micromonospora coxensis]
MRRFLASLLVPLITVVVTGSTGGPAAATGAFPTTISLPDGFAPEGLTIGRGTTVYVGSILDGAVWRGDLRTGRGAVFIPGTPGTDKAGLKVDRHNRLWTADFSGGGATVYDARTGARLQQYRFTDQPGSLINDVVITRTAAYFTDSTRPVLYVVPVGPGDRLPEADAFEVLTLSGPAADAGAFNNGIVALPDGDLLVVQMLLGRLVRVDATTGGSRVVDLGGYSLSRGDGLVLRGHTLHVIRNLTNLAAEIRLDATFTSGTLVRELDSPAFQVPATGDRLGSSLYVVNGRFDTAPAPDVEYHIVRLPL